MGNHEAMAFATIDETIPAGAWLAQGGAATLRSYGVVSARALPHAHVTWLRSLRTRKRPGHPSGATLAAIGEKM
jgi:serine/threonine protein phosphatase 1